MIELKMQMVVRKLMWAMLALLHLTHIDSGWVELHFHLLWTRETVICALSKLAYIGFVYEVADLQIILEKGEVMLIFMCLDGMFV